MKQAFNIPGINNQKDAFAKHMKINSDIDSELSKIEENGVYGSIGRQVHCFRFDGQLYSVASSTVGLAVDKLMEFNSNLWAIKVINPESPYERFTDTVVLNKLETIAPSGYTLLAINQKELKILFRNESGLLVAFKYTSHIPDDISTYYLIGDSVDHINEIRRVFENKYTFNVSDLTI